MYPFSQTANQSREPPRAFQGGIFNYSLLPTNLSEKSDPALRCGQRVVISTGYPVDKSVCVQKLHTIAQASQSPGSLIVCSTHWLVCCMPSPLRPVAFCLSLLPAGGSWLAQLQPSRLRSCWNGPSWWLEMVEAVKWGKLVAGGWMLASMLPTWCPSLQGFRSRRRGRREVKYRRGEWECIKG